MADDPTRDLRTKCMEFVVKTECSAELIALQLVHLGNRVSERSRLLVDVRTTDSLRWPAEFRQILKKKSVFHRLNT